MPITDELLARASCFDIPAVEDVLSHYRPAVHRLATALSGRAKTGAAITRQVLLKSLGFVETWDDVAKVDRWFYHQTIISARPYAERPPTTKADVLLPAGASADPPSLAFVKALRDLPHQQREAYLLTVGEQLSPRSMATAMDFSLEASGNHLGNAKRTLKSIAGDHHIALELAVATTYAMLTPAGDETLPLVRSAINRHVWPKRLKVLGALVLLIAVLGGLAWGIWTIYPMLDI